MLRWLTDNSDISDYQKIDPRYGTLEDWDNLRDACHERGMKLVMDLVVNHSSNEVSLERVYARVARNGS